MDHKSRSPDEHRSRAASVLKAAGHKDVKQDKSLMAAMVHKHETHDHPGKPLTKFAAGGKVGPKAVNVVIHTGASDQEKKQAQQQGMQMGAALGARAAAAKMAPQGAGAGPRPPMGQPPSGMAPPSPGMKDGGKIQVSAHERAKPIRAHD